MNFSSPLISVVVPTFDVASKIEATLRSVLQGQAPFESLEVLVMDGASTDDTLQIVRRWAARDARVRVWSEPDEGLYDAMNKGVARATGQMLYFLGAGDLVRPGVFAELSRLPDLHPLLLLHGWVAHEGATIAPGAGAKLQAIDLARFNIPHQGAFYGRGVFELVGLYSLRFRIYSDHEFNWRCWTNARVEKRPWHRVVADFESGGLSASRHDPEFARDWPGLVWRRGGPLPWLSLQLSQRFSVRQLRWFQFARALLRRRRTN